MVFDNSEIDLIKTLYFNQITTPWNYIKDSFSNIEKRYNIKTYINLSKLNFQNVEHGLIETGYLIQENQKDSIFALCKSLWDLLQKMQSFKLIDLKTNVTSKEQINLITEEKGIFFITTPLPQELQHLYNTTITYLPEIKTFMKKGYKTYQERSELNKSKRKNFKQWFLTVGIPILVALAIGIATIIITVKSNNSKSPIPEEHQETFESPEKYESPNHDEQETNSPIIAI